MRIVVEEVVMMVERRMDGWIDEKGSSLLCTYLLVAKVAI